MPASTTSELEAFHRFVAEQLRNGGSRLSPEDCLNLWRATQRERAEANEGIRRGLAELEAGLGRPLHDFAQEFRTRNNIAPDV